MIIILVHLPTDHVSGINCSTSCMLMDSVLDLLIRGLCLTLTKILVPVVPLSTIQWKVYNHVLCFVIIYMYLLDNDISGGSSIGTL